MLQLITHGLGVAFVVIEAAAIVSIPSVLLTKRGHPRSAVAWILALFAIPGLGVVLWWLLGRTRIARKSRIRREKAREFANRHGSPPSEPGTTWAFRVPARALDTCIFPSEGNRVSLLFDGAEAYRAMEEAIASAKKSVHALFYIWRDDVTGRRWRDLLVDKARAGVTVRVLTDSWGSPHFMRKLAPPLVAAGGRVSSFFPSRLYPLRAPRLNFVNHRKILLVDDALAFTGGMNVGDEYRFEWHDIMTRLEGPAVDALSHVFLDDWYFASGEDVEGPVDSPARGDVSAAVVASGPDTEDWLHSVFFYAISHARKRVFILTPYFIPSDALLKALSVAADVGIHVQVLLPGHSDVPIVKLASRPFYRPLLDSGVRVYEHRGAVIHGKALVVDDSFASVGSANLDTRSLQLSFEVGCFVSDPELTSELMAYGERLLEDSEEMTIEKMRNRPRSRKLLEATAHLLSPLL